MQQSEIDVDIPLNHKEIIQSFVWFLQYKTESMFYFEKKEKENENSFNLVLHFLLTGKDRQMASSD